MKEAILKGTAEGRGFRESANEYLRSYRATPHSVTNVSPFEAMYGRRMRVGLAMRVIPSYIIDRDQFKEKQKKMDEVGRGRSHGLSIGDPVLIRQRRKDKLTTPFRGEPLAVTRVRGSMVTAQGQSGSYTCGWFASNLLSGRT